MKKYFLLLCFTILLSTIKAQTGYTVKVKLSNWNNEKISIGYERGYMDFVTDSNYTVKNGWVIFKGSVTEPLMAYLNVGAYETIKLKVGSIPGTPSLRFFLSNDEIVITGDVKAVCLAEVSGGAANAEFATLRRIENKMIHQDWIRLKMASKALKPGGDSTELENAIKLRTNNLFLRDKRQNAFMKANPGALYSMYSLNEQMLNRSPESLKAEFEKLDDKYKNSKYGREIALKIKNDEATAIGQNAIQLQKKDINGNDVNLKTLQGKYVILDFWGSWCKACRAGNPHLMELYAKYKADGLEIVGIANELTPDLEDAKVRWRKALKEDGINWIHVLNNEGIREFDAVKAYGVMAYPTKILLDKTGKIIARYIGNDPELDNKLKELLGE